MDVMAESVEIDKLKEQIITLGRAAVHSLKPDEFEYYLCSFELINSSFETEDILHFPIMPYAMSISGTMPASIKKTARGYLAQISDSFVGRQISINGSFGRRFKILLSGSDSRVSPDVPKVRVQELKIRTGYGALKLMEKIIFNAFQPDDSGAPRFLIFHNHAYNQISVVEVSSFQVNQSMENNMLWNYSIEMKAVADYSKMVSFNSEGKILSKMLMQGIGQQSINRLVGDINLGAITKTFNL